MGSGRENPIEIMGAAVSDFNSHEFMRGQKDCKDGFPHREGQSESYDRGYRAQYQLEQVLDARTTQTTKRAV